MIRLNWADAPEDYVLEDYAVCLCKAGKAWRVDTNNGRKTNPMWHIWCGIRDISIDRVVMIEELLTPAELSERGLYTAEPETNREAALLAASRKRR